MDLREYFEQTEGRGILATADKDGRVDVAIYGRPHFQDDGTAAFIMAERLTHENLKTNPWAAYIFMEAGEGYAGKRLYLKKIREDQNEQLIKEMRRRNDHVPSGTGATFIVYFKVDKVLPLKGSGDKAAK